MVYREPPVDAAGLPAQPSSQGRAAGVEPEQLAARRSSSLAGRSSWSVGRSSWSVGWSSWSPAGSSQLCFLGGRLSQRHGEHFPSTQHSCRKKEFRPRPPKCLPSSRSWCSEDSQVQGCTCRLEQRQKLAFCQSASQLDRLSTEGDEGPAGGDGEHDDPHLGHPGQPGAVPLGEELALTGDHVLRAALDLLAALGLLGARS